MNTIDKLYDIAVGLHFVCVCAWLQVEVGVGWGMVGNIYVRCTIRNNKRRTWMEALNPYKAYTV